MGSFIYIYIYFFLTKSPLAAQTAPGGGEGGKKGGRKKGKGKICISRNLSKKNVMQPNFEFLQFVFHNLSYLTISVFEFFLSQNLSF